MPDDGYLLKLSDEELHAGLNGATWRDVPSKRQKSDDRISRISSSIRRSNT